MAEQVRQAAAAYVELGWCPVPVRYRAKRPAAVDTATWDRLWAQPDLWHPGRPASTDDWQNGTAWQFLRLTPAALPLAFSEPCNIGINLGEPSDGLVDVDLDCPEAIELAPRFLPRTLTFGRTSKPRSHWLYRAPGSLTMKKADRTAGAVTLVELRATPGEHKGEGVGGHQTVLPPSVHESGEPVEWSEDADGRERPTEVRAGELKGRVLLLAEACMLLRHAPREAVAAWLDGGAYPAAPPAVLRQIREWQGYTPPAPKPAKPRRAAQPDEALAAAIERFNRENTPAGGWGRGGSRPCPVCCTPNGCHCFGSVHDSPVRWFCFNPDHPATCGQATSDGYWGDSLDVEAYQAGASRIDLLKRHNYLADTRRTKP